MGFACPACLARSLFENFDLSPIFSLKVELDLTYRQWARSAFRIIQRQMNLLQLQRYIVLLT